MSVAAPAATLPLICDPRHAGPLVDGFTARTPDFMGERQRLPDEARLSSPP